MVDKITLSVLNNDTQKPFTILTENKDFINSIITVGENNTVKDTDIKLLQQIAGRNGDLGILEECDLTMQEKINLANYRGFDKFYDIKLSNDRKYLQVTIKETTAFNTDPNLRNIKVDFGVRDNVFVGKGYIPHGNEEVISKAPKGTGGGNNIDYDTAKLRPGQTINIPVEEVHFREQARGWWARLIN